eukprot:gene19709-biopygen17519
MARAMGMFRLGARAWRGLCPVTPALLPASRGAVADACRTRAKQWDLKETGSGRPWTGLPWSFFFLAG